MRLCLALALALTSLPLIAAAHVSERALVLLLPTDIYIRSGVIAVALTVALLFLLPPSFFKTAFSPVRLAALLRLPLGVPLSLISTAILAAALYAGITGTRDPLQNPLPLLIWTLWWILMPVLSAVFGNIWAAINPWSGIARLLRVPLRRRTPPRFAGALILIVFSTFVVADIAPDDPDRLAWIVGGYWVFTFLMILIFGQIWLEEAEPFSVYFRTLARLSPFWRAPDLHAAVPGARLSRQGASLPLALLLIIALAAGSFDGLNETFWWLGNIGINPLEFPGRSAVALPNTLGLLAAMAMLACVLAAATYLGLATVGAAGLFRTLFARLTLSLIPIALGYHIAHYLTSFMVGAQYALAAASDPLARGDDILGLGQFYVTTSFFNVPETVEAIWLTQAGAIVIGHIIAVLVAHAIALDALGDHRKATLSQLPVAAFMVAYTFFGLWILAQPTGA